MHGAPALPTELPGAPQGIQLEFCNRNLKESYNLQLHAAFEQLRKMEVS